MSRTGGILAVLLLLLDGCRSAATGTTPASTGAIRRGTAYLLAHQNPDGSWGSFSSGRPEEADLGTVASHHAFWDASTALAAMGLMGVPGDDPAVRNAVDRALDRLVADGPAVRATGDILYSPWGNLYALQCLARACRDARWAPDRERLAEAARKRIALLAQEQSALGGWSYYDFQMKTRRPSGLIATSFATAAAIVAMDEARQAGLEMPPVMMREAVHFLAPLRNGNGAFLYSPDARYHPNGGVSKIKGSLGRSEAGNCALARCGRDVGEHEIIQGLENFFKYHYVIAIGRQRPIPHEGWYQTAGYYYFFGHYYAALNIAGLPEAERSRFAPQLAHILVQDQEPDSSWWDFPLYTYSKAYGTGLALLALEAIQPLRPTRPTSS